ncbi:DUF3455 domain-containing protein [Dyadobacter sp. CY107]|uniref:DUF3455 domain-containing protein n=1 Tax=Dyadobacter fanqingshengii TaxID=2906443 RepID=UPI001F206628|nr:DUF3455 domain-containing protein [Dyadobacter fanqingshengii]MCF2506334.1 DUF3455 domain-containing protein [Dyadobacter fanqingshengii]
MIKIFHSFTTLIRMAVFAAVSLTACTDHVDPDTSSPAFKIAQALALPVPAAVALPANPNGNSPVAVYFAEGVQRYKAQEKLYSYPTSYEWVFVEPEADLFAVSNAKVGRHFGGPSWTVDATNSLIVGQQFSPAKTTNVDPQHIDWLLLMPKTGTIPNGRFQETDYIQRIATKGGRAPVVPPGNALETVDVPYTAVYIFSKINP